MRKKIAILAATLVLAMGVLASCGGRCDLCGSSGEITEVYGVPLPFALPCPEC